MNYLSPVPKSTEDMIRKISIIEDNLKEQLENLKDLRLSLLGSIDTEGRIPTGAINVDLVHRVIDVVVYTNVIEKKEEGLYELETLQK